MGKNPGSIIGNSVNKSDQVLVHWLLWSRPVLIFNSCCHTRTQTHTQTHTPRLTRSTAQSLALLRAESWSERSGARCVFSGLLVCAERARILWIMFTMCTKRSARLLDLDFVAFSLWDRQILRGIYCGRSVIGAFHYPSWNPMSGAPAWQRFSVFSQGVRILAREL